MKFPSIRSYRLWPGCKNFVTLDDKEVHTTHPFFHGTVNIVSLIWELVKLYFRQKTLTGTASKHDHFTSSKQQQNRPFSWTRLLGTYGRTTFRFVHVAPRLSGRAPKVAIRLAFNSRLETIEFSSIPLALKPRPVSHHCCHVIFFPFQLRGG